MYHTALVNSCQSHTAYVEPCAMGLWFQLFMLFSGIVCYVWSCYIYACYVYSCSHIVHCHSKDLNSPKNCAIFTWEYTCSVFLYCCSVILSCFNANKSGKTNLNAVSFLKKYSLKKLLFFCKDIRHCVCMYITKCRIDRGV